MPCFSTGDLPAIHASPYFFANKFKLKEDRIVYGCLEQRLYNRTRDVYIGRQQVNTSVYEESILVRNRLRNEDIELKFPKESQVEKLD